MYYSGSNTTSTNSTWHIGLATSTDGLNWTRYASNPVLKAGVDTYDYYGLTDPTVLVANGTWYIWYGGNRNGTSLDIDICYATSTDGYNWSKYASNPVLRNNDNNSAWNAYADEARVDLRVGMNVIEVECVDAAGNTGTSVWTMEREEATGMSSIALVAVGVVVALALVVVVIYWTRLSKE